MVTTLENLRLRAGDSVRVRIGAAVYEGKVIDASDPAKLLVELDTGKGVWIGRKAVESKQANL